MPKNRSLYICLMVCLLGLFLLPMSSAQIDTKNSETSDESLSLLIEKTKISIASDRVVDEMQDDVTVLGEFNNKLEGTVDKKLDLLIDKGLERKKEIEVNLPQASTEKTIDHEEPLKLASNQMKMNSSKKMPPELNELEPEQGIDPSETVQQGQNSPVDYKSRERSYLKKGQIDDAITDFNKAIELNPEDAAAYFYRGNASYGKGQIEKAVSDYTKAIERSPRYTNAYFSRGYVYLITGEYSKAIYDYNMVIDIHPDNAYAYNYRGCGYFAQEDYKGALDDFSKAIELDPGYIDAYRNRGYIYYDVKKMYRRAIEDYSKAIELNPDDAVNYYLRGDAYFKNRNTHRALSDFNMAIKLNPKFDNAYVSKGNIYFSRGNFAKAVENNEKALDLNPDNAIAKRLRVIYAERAENRQYAEWGLITSPDYSSHPPSLPELIAMGIDVTIPLESINNFEK